MFEEIGAGLFMIDAQMFGAPENLSTYVIPEPVPTLIEPGPTTCHGAVMAGLAEMGIDDIAQVAVTHIHLDHAGGAGHMSERFPKAQIFVHQIGAPHLADPTKLVNSATRIYGHDGMRELWGDIHPVDSARMTAVDDGDVISVGPNRHLDVVYTPGHAKHHMSFVDSETGIVMIGDSVGLTFPGIDIVHPVVPPPDIDVELLIAQFDKYRAIQAPILGFAHFGLKYDVEAVLVESERRLRMWTDVADRHRNDSPEAVATLIAETDLDDMRAAGHPESDIERMRGRSDYAANTTGLLRYVHKHRPHIH